MKRERNFFIQPFCLHFILCFLLNLVSFLILLLCFLGHQYLFLHLSLNHPNFFQIVLQNHHQNLAHHWNLINIIFLIKGIPYILDGSHPPPKLVSGSSSSSSTHLSQSTYILVYFLSSLVNFFQYGPSSFFLIFNCKFLPYFVHFDSLKNKLKKESYKIYVDIDVPKKF
jgi:hypothetical protein